MAELKVFETCLAGYNGATDETDHLVKWIAAPSIEVAQQFLNKRKITGNSPLTEIEHEPVDVDEGIPYYSGIDVILDEFGNPLSIRYFHTYEHCGKKWKFEYDAICTDACPVCEAYVAPEKCIDAFGEEY